MLLHLRWLGLLAILGFVFPASGADEPNPKKKTTTKTTKKKGMEEEDPLAKNMSEKFTLLGPAKVMKVEGDKVIIEMQVPDPVKIAELERWAVQQQQAIAQTPFNQRQQKIQQYQSDLAQKQKNLTKVQPTPLTLGKDYIVRTADLPQVFDGKGDLKTFTKEQRDELRGKEGYPGYPTDIDALVQGTVARFYTLTELVKEEQDKMKDKPKDKDPPMKGDGVKPPNGVGGVGGGVKPPNGVGGGVKPPNGGGGAIGGGGGIGGIGGMQPPQQQPPDVTKFPVYMIYVVYQPKK